MSDNQLHGKKFEDFIKACGLFPGASDAARSTTAGFDIEARFDRQHGLPTSIKASGDNFIALSDARRFFALDVPFRMIVGRYQQEGDRKIFAEIHEFLLDVAALTDLRGGLSLEVVSAFHAGLLLDQFPRGRHQAGRKWAAARKAELAAVETAVILNPKIGAGSQRRLQCSVRITDLIRVCAAPDSYVLHDLAIGDFVLPVIQNSKRRKFQNRA